VVPRALSLPFDLNKRFLRRLMKREEVNPTTYNIYDDKAFLFYFTDYVIKYVIICKIRKLYHIFVGTK